MRRILFILLLVMLGLGLAGGIGAWAYFHGPADYDRRLAKIERLAERGAAKGRWAGVMWAVVAPGAVLDTGAAGFADLAQGRAMRADTIMPIGSISKVLVGYAGALAAGEGALDLDAPIREVLSIAFDPSDGSARSFADLATHAAGIEDTDAGYEEVGYHYGDVVHPVPLAQFLARYLGQDGDLYASENFAPHAPGTAYAYSNIGAGLAAQVIADATGVPFADYSSAAIAPLGLSGFWGNTGETSPLSATLYGRDEDNGFDPLPPYGLATWPDGQFNASGRDLARLFAAMLGQGRLDGQQLLNADALTLQQTPRLSGVPGKDSDGDWIGLFWERETQSIGPMKLTFEGHSGGDPGVVTFMYRAPGSDTGFVLMFNSEPRHMGDILEIVRLARLLAGMPLK